MLALLSGFMMHCSPADKINSSPSLRLSFSTDTVLFDTVFTTIGSSTRSFKVYNRNNYRVNISDIHLAGGVKGKYRVESGWFNNWEYTYEKLFSKCNQSNGWG